MTSTLRLLNICHCTNCHAATTGRIRLTHWRTTVHNRPCWKIRTLNMLHEIVKCRLWIINQRYRCVNNLTKIMCRNIRRHTNSNTNLSVKQQIWQLRWQYNRLPVCRVVCIAKINSFFVNIRQKRLGHARHFCFSVAHCRWRIPIHRAKVALTLHERIASNPILRHTHHCIID